MSILLATISRASYGDNICSGPPVGDDHLLPISFEVQLPYRAVLTESLFLSTGEYGRAVIRPPFEGESCVAIYSLKRGEAETDIRVAYTKADKNIWYAQMRPIPPSAKQAIHVKHVEAPIARSTALAIANVWKEMLCRTRPIENTRDGPVEVDSTTIEFSLVKQGQALYGQSPQQRGKHTNALYELTRSLVAYCEVEEFRRASVAKQIEDRANALLADLNRDN